MLLPLLLVSLLVLVADYYVEAACVSRLDATRTGRCGTLAVLGGALVLGAVWNHPLVAQMTTSAQGVSDVTAVEHELSAGVIFSCVLFAFGAVAMLLQNLDLVDCTCPLHLEVLLLLATVLFV